MAYEQLIQIIEAARRQGKTPDLRRIDLAAADLKGLDLSGVDLSGANLSRANLRKVRLTDANLTGTDLSHANLNRADLRNARLDEANLTRADLSRANLAHSTLQGANLLAANLNGSDLTGVNLLEARLRHANLRKGAEKPDWRGFLQHLGPYVMVIGALGIVNAVVTPTFPWFLFPAVAWGIGLSVHFWNLVIRSIPNLSGKWRGFLDHLSAYVSVIGALGIINAMVTPTFPWFLFPAAGWGVGLAIHLWNALISDSEDEELFEIEQAQQVEQPLVREREVAQPQPRQQPIAEKGLTNKTLQLHLDKALAYRDQINSMLATTSDDVASTRLQDLARQVDEWTEAIADLARRVDRYQQNTLLQHDIESVPQSIADLEARLARETDEATRMELQRTLTNRQNQLTSLERLQNMMKRAEIQIESTLSALGTIYSQMLTGQSTNHVADYSRLSTEVDEEVRILQDQLEALEEVKLARE